VQKAVRHHPRVGNILPAELIFERPTRHKGILSYINITTGCPGFLIALVDGTWWGPSGADSWLGSSIASSWLFKNKNPYVLPFKPPLPGP